MWTLLINQLYNFFHAMLLVKNLKEMRIHVNCLSAMKDAMCLVLGIRDEDGDDQTVPFASNPPASEPIDERLLSEAAIPVDDNIPEEHHTAFDRDNPKMDAGCLYPSMTDFRLVIRQFAVNEEFDMNISKTDRTSYMGECKAKGCNWKITARITADKKTIRVNKVEQPDDPQEYQQYEEYSQEPEPSYYAPDPEKERVEGRLPHHVIVHPQKLQAQKLQSHMGLQLPVETIAIPSSLQNSPGPVTRRQLALAMADGECQGSVPTTSPKQIKKTTSTAKKITLRKKKLCL